jgi:hypothetical protein
MNQNEVASKKMAGLDQFKKDMQNTLFGKTEPGHCVICKQKVTGFKDSLSEKEYGISGMCQECQDKTFR